jgi:hypothetical protein
MTVFATQTVDNLLQSSRYSLFTLERAQITQTTKYLKEFYKTPRGLPWGVLFRL